MFGISIFTAGWSLRHRFELTDVDNSCASLECVHGLCTCSSPYYRILEVAAQPQEEDYCVPSYELGHLVSIHGGPLQRVWGDLLINIRIVRQSAGQSRLQN